MDSMTILQLLIEIIFPALISTFKMLIVAAILSSCFGFIIAVILIVTEKDGLRPNKVIYKTLNTIVNTIRSLPFIILMVSIVPLTRFIVGTSIGEKAAIVPLTIAFTQFMARIIQGSLKEVSPSLIEAAKSFGASDMQIIFRFMLVEAVPSIISGLSLAIINLLSATAMAGAIGAGGLGAVALTYGYQSFNDRVMYSTVVVLIIVVQCIQFIGDFAYKKLK